MPLDTMNFISDVVQEDEPYQEDVDAIRVVRENEDAIRVLKRALQLLERGWTRKAYARFLFIPLPSEASWATHYCAKGALNRASFELGLSCCRAEDMLNGIPGVNGNLIDYNDKHTKKDVLHIFKYAIIAKNL